MGNNKFNPLILTLFLRSSSSFNGSSLCFDIILSFLFLFSLLFPLFLDGLDEHGIFPRSGSFFDF